MTTLKATHQIADGNNNAAGLTLFTALTDANSVPLPMPQMKGTRNKGIRRDRQDGSPAYIGKPSIRLIFTALTLAQIYLMENTYEGAITIRIPLIASTYANYNAQLVVPQESDLQYRRGVRHVTWLGQTWSGYGPVEYIVRKLEAL